MTDLVTGRQGLLWKTNDRTVKIYRLEGKIKANKSKNQTTEKSVVCLVPSVRHNKLALQA